MATSVPKDDVKVTGQNDLAPTTSYIDGEVLDEEIDHGYLSASKFTKFYRSVLFQMILLGLLSCVGPAMSDAISNLGGGGLSTPYLANLATSLNYTAGCLLTLFGGPLINKFGIKWSCTIAAVGMPLSGSAYYVCAKYRVNWYLIFAKILTGFTYGFLYVAESTAMLSYPLANDRGFYLGIWSAMRNSGSVIGGAINFSNNHSDSKAGGVAWSTYLVFIAFDGCDVVIAPRFLYPIEPAGSKSLTWLMALPAFYSFFCGGTMGTYLSLHFSVRARALSSLLLPTLSIILVIAYGKLLDRSRWSQTKRAWISFACWLIPQAACFIWIGVEYAKFGPGQLENALDYKTNTRRWAEAYLPYLIMQSTSYVCQLSLYWILGTFSTNAGSSARSGGLLRAFETAGQTVSYAINSHSGSDARIPFYVHAAILCLTVPCMVFLIQLVPEAPAATDIDAEPVMEGVPDNKQVI
ncbi:major facilitator superfamily domain-containing protein [Fusarium redolens]|uniref:Major facilitator superfamily domain-containing protein n=1 Tax=Fusarium redolens TaxID=48865 RepID=A0A9P9HYP5_FUSRE|nr:major facilitator superfamily domain-containing protein [Fusarium redolens]KAH7265656.1 major facilitator superfamily domain-containing protein [Fusarium redolens]